jgi:signal peptidase II
MTALRIDKIKYMRSKYYLVALLVLAIDHITKLIVRGSLGNGRIVEIIPGYLRFSYVSNSGVAFGLFDGLQSFWKPYILAGMAAVALAVIIVYSARLPRDRILLQLALAITMGGILGNFIDRIIRGYVIDFIEFHIHESFYWPNFNAADSAITIGIALLLLDTVMHPTMEEVAEQ